MKHEPVYLTPKIRRLLFVLQISVFFLVFPSLLLYSLGYRYDLTKKIVRETGVISFEVEPEEALVLRNGVKVKPTSKAIIGGYASYELRDIIPGNHRLIFSYFNHVSENIDIDLNAGKTFYLGRIRLFSETEAVPLAIIPILDSQIVTDQEGVIWIHRSTDGLNEISFFDQKNQQQIPIFREAGEVIFSFFDHKPLKPAIGGMIFRPASATTSFYYEIDLQKKEIGRPIPLPEEPLDFLLGDGKLIKSGFLGKSGWWEIQTIGNFDLKISDPKKIGFGTKKITRSDDGTLYALSADKLALSALDRPDTTLTLPKAIKLIINLYKDGQIIYLDDKNSLIVADLKSSFFSEIAEPTSYVLAEDNLLFVGTSGGEIWKINREKSELITRRPAPINAIAYDTWHDSVIFESEGKLISYRDRTATFLEIKKDYPNLDEIIPDPKKDSRLIIFKDRDLFQIWLDTI